MTTMLVLLIVAVKRLDVANMKLLNVTMMMLALLIVVVLNLDVNILLLYVMVSLVTQPAVIMKMDAVILP
jgi:hypothetical protein